MLPWCLVLAALPLPGRAEPPAAPVETVIRLSVTPMAAPQPALRYLLLPELKELNPGNPIPNYLRCIVEPDVSTGREVIGRDALRQADRAARLDKPDWQILTRLKTDGIGLLLPDVQKMRSLTNGLQGRFHDEVVRRHFDDAIVTAKTMFAMSRHMGEHPTLIGGLVGIAMAIITIGPLEEMIQQPGCPNLYWALTNLPSPLVSLDKGLEGERVLILSEFHDLDDRKPMNATQIRKLIEHIDKLREFDRKPKKQSTREWLDAQVKDAGRVRAARDRLVEFGLPEEQVRQFPADQVMLLEDRRRYEVHRDELMKLMVLAPWQGEALAAQIKSPKDPALFDLLTPAVMKVRRAQGRLEQRLALLRHVEALRLYAAAHDGRLPAALADIDVPLPPDPFTGRPFRYAVDGATAHLRGSPPPGEDKNPAYNVHYEITLQK
jgi:hypothetical protein